MATGNRWWTVYRWGWQMCSAYAFTKEGAVVLARDSFRGSDEPLMNIWDWYAEPVTNSN